MRARRSGAIGARRCGRGVRAAGSREPRAHAERSCPPGQPAHRGRGARACCSTARTPRCCCARSATRREFRIALPQTGRFADLKSERDRCCSASIRSAPSCFPAAPERRARWLAHRRAPTPRSPVACALRADPAARPGAAVARRADRPAARRSRACCRCASGSARATTSPSLAQYRTFFTEPLYWHVFVRTALMSVLATLLTLLLAFPIAWIIAKLARGRARLAAVHRCA